MAGELTPQEMQLMMAFMAANRGNKTTSNLLGSLDNPALAVMSGAYDPRTAVGTQPGSGPYWSKYLQSQDPVIQDIMRKIVEENYDKYQLNSHIDRLAMQPGGLGSFQVTDLKGVAKELQKEYVNGPATSGGAASKDNFSKAGIPDPGELYDVSTVPLSAPNAKKIRDIQTKLATDTFGYDDAVYNVNVARRNLGQGSATTEGGKRLKTSDVLNWIGKSSGKGKGALGLNRARSYLKNNPSEEITLSDLSNVLKQAGDKAYKYSNPKGVDAKKFQEGISQVTGKAKQAQGLGYNKAANKKYDDAMTRKMRMEAEAYAAREAEKAVREGQLDAAMQSGATPANDALKTMVRFIALTRSK